ncbi:MAG: DUF58 domain-containing protein [Armatimonadota bacterium]|nr:DUF58 domain-containing protein [Armatimonadota bacterium]
MSRNFRIFALAAVVLWAVGAMNDARVMYVLAGVCGAVMLVAFLLSQLALTRLRVQMSPPGRNAVAGAPIRPELHVRSVGGITVGSAAVEATLENLTVEGVTLRRRFLLPPMPPLSELDLELELAPPLRGRYRLRPPALIDTDPIGMFEQRRERGEAHELVVFPRTYDLPPVAAWEAGYGRYAFRGRDARRDQGEFRGIREHTPGDDLRHVHWKVTAHVGELAVKEYEPIRHDLISVHLDLLAGNHYGQGAVSTLETAISAAASIARAGLAEQRSVAVFGEGLPQAVSRSGSGQPHLHRIMVALAEARLVEDGAFAASLASQLRSVPRGASVFVVTTAVEEPLVEVIAARSGAAGSVTLVVVRGDLEGAPERFAVIPRRTVESARAAGIQVAVLRSPADITEALAAAATARRSAVGAF